MCWTPSAVAAKAGNGTREIEDPLFHAVAKYLQGTMRQRSKARALDLSRGAVYLSSNNRLLLRRQWQASL